MSQIEKLIIRLCPQGVDDVSLESLFYFRKGQNLTNDQAITGSYPVITASRGSTFSHNDFNFDGECLTISSHGAYAGFVSYFNQKFWLGNNVYLFESKTEGISTRFYFHVLKSQAQALLGTVNTGGIPYINAKDLKSLRVPHPPIEVQNEIVRILDTFTELEAELESELEARKIQYSEYLRITFDFSKRVEVRWTEIGKVCSTFSGAFVKKTEQNDDFEYPVFNGGSTETGYYNKFNSPENSIAISARGSIGAVNWVRTKFWAGNSCHVVLATDPELDNRFLYHYLKFHEPSLYALRAVGSIPALNLKPLLKFPVPLPPLEEQRKISRLLDKFELLINDISIGLPGEITSRRQQYEFYRHKLLTFKALDVA